jgi:hypothetical protein
VSPNYSTSFLTVLALLRRPDSDHNDPRSRYSVTSAWNVRLPGRVPLPWLVGHEVAVDLPCELRGLDLVRPAQADSVPLPVVVAEAGIPPSASAPPDHDPLEGALRRYARPPWHVTTRDNASACMTSQSERDLLNNICISAQVAEDLRLGLNPVF